MHLAAVAFHVIGELGEVRIEVLDDLALHLARPVAEPLEARNLANRLQPVCEQAQRRRAVGLEQARIAEGPARAHVNLVAVDARVVHSRC